MILPTWNDFKKMADRGNLIPLFEEIHLDCETPISLFKKIDDGRFSFLLESGEGNERWARYSFLGKRPSHLLRTNGKNFERWHGERLDQKGEADHPLKALQDLLRAYRPVGFEGLPRFFGGAVGFISYDVVRFFERLPEKAIEEIEVDSSHFMITDTLVIFDKVTQKVTVVANLFLEEYPSLERAYEEGRAKIECIVSELTASASPQPPNCSPSPPLFRNHLKKEQFLEMVKKAKAYIRGGDIIQVVLSQRFSAELRCDPFDLYRALRATNPSPYLFFLRFGESVHLGASPEVLVRLEERTISLRPLAGTRRRGKNPEEDRALEVELLNDEKERAEHIMLVDLGRNDVGRVAEVGSVRVTELMGVERYSHVMHIVSHIQGTLAQGRNAFDVFRAAFPAGTVTGAPKIRAMEIIDELEPVRRGPYAGAVGYFGFSGNMDTCIAIRSLFVKDGIAYFQAGAGIVADSDPEKEYEETLNKARAIFKAFELVKGGWGVR